MMASVCQTRVESAPAKLNLTLKVLGRRADGYHEIESLVAFARDVADSVTLTPSTTHKISFSGPFSDGLGAAPTTLTTTRDLLLRAAGEAQSDDKFQLGDIAVEKNIPLASGLGGGSADAAALLRAVMACNPMWQDRLDLPTLARAIGADVPVCLASQAQFMSGIGDRLAQVSQFPELAVVLIKTNDAPLADKTQRVFANLNAGPLGSIADPQPAESNVTAFARAEDVAAFMNEIGNDLLPSARTLMPALDAPLERVSAQPLCLAASLSGAGPTVFGLFAERVGAETAACALQKAEPSWWVRASTLV